LNTFNPADALVNAVDTFKLGQPVGDGIGPIIASKYMAGLPKQVVAKDTVMSVTEFKGRTLYVLKAEGPMGYVGEPGLAIQRVIEEMNVPVIAAVNGFAVTGGFEMVLACDMIVASEDAQFADDAGGAGEHVIDERGGIGKDDALDGAVGDVAFVPEGDVFVGGEHIAAHDAGEAADLFAADGIALVGHGGAAALFATEVLFGFADFGALEVANFDGDFFERRGDERER